MSMAPKKQMQEYVVEYGNGEVYKKNGKAAVILAFSEKDAARKACSKHHFGGGDWDIRLAGDEPRIEAIEGYADICYRVGVLDRQIAELNEQRRALWKEAESYKHGAYQLPEEVIPF
jgi:hypothetical protein